MDHQDLLNHIGTSLDIELAFDKYGQCFLLLDEHLMVSVRSVDQAWILYGMLAKLEEEDHTKDIARSMLAQNVSLAESGSGSIVLESESNVLMLVRRIATTHIDGQRMQELLSDFVDALDAALGAFKDKRPPEPTSVPTFAAHPGLFERA